LPSHGPSSSREMTLRLAAQSIIAVNNNPTTLAGGWLRIPPGPPANVEHLERLSRPAPRQLARHADQQARVASEQSRRRPPPVLSLEQPPLPEAAAATVTRLTAVRADSRTFMHMQLTLDRYFPPERRPVAAATGGGSDAKGGAAPAAPSGDSANGDAAAADTDATGTSDAAKVMRLHRQLSRYASLRAKQSALTPAPKQLFPARDLREQPVPPAAEARRAALSRPPQRRVRGKYKPPAPEAHDLHRRTCVPPDTLQRLEELARPHVHANSAAAAAAAAAAPSTAPAVSAAAATGATVPAVKADAGAAD